MEASWFGIKHVAFAVSVAVSLSPGGFVRIGQSVPLYVPFRSFLRSMAGRYSAAVCVLVGCLILSGCKTTRGAKT